MQEKDNSPVPLNDQLCYAIYSAGIAIQRVYKPFLDTFGLTYPQYLVLNVLWRDNELTVGGLAERLALESSTLTPLLKRLEAAGLVHRTRNPGNERQVIITPTAQAMALKARAGCLGDALLAASGETPSELGDLNRDVRKLRDAIYTHISGWSAPV